MPRSWTDRELLEGVASHQEEAVCAFNDAARKRLPSLARRRGLSHEDAEDAVQETLIAAVRQIQQGRFDGRAPLWAWVVRILAKRCADASRQNFRRGRLLVEGGDLAALEALTAAADWREFGPEVSLRVRETLNALPPRERLVLVLNKQQGLTTREIAPILRLGMKTVESVLTRAKKRFCEIILETEESAGPKRLK